MKFVITLHEYFKYTVNFKTSVNDNYSESKRNGSTLITPQIKQPTRRSRRLRRAAAFLMMVYPLLLVFYQ